MTDQAGIWYVLAMTAETFTIKSLLVQNGIMAFFLFIILVLFIRAVIKKNKKQMLAIFIWLVIGLWFFNSPFFGFSTVRVSPDGITLNYGFLSIHNETLPLESGWKIETYLSGIRKNRRLFYIAIAGRESMRVTPQKKELLDMIGKAIDHTKKTIIG